MNFNSKGRTFSQLGRNFGFGWNKFLPFRSFTTFALLQITGTCKMRRKTRKSLSYKNIFKFWSVIGSNWAVHFWKCQSNYAGRYIFSTVFHEDFKNVDFIEIRPHPPLVVQAWPDFTCSILLIKKSSWVEKLSFIESASKVHDVVDTPNIPIKLNECKSQLSLKYVLKRRSLNY